MSNANPSTKQELSQELKGLLREWDALLVTQAAAQRDYERLSRRIIEICNLLDALDGGVR